MIKCKIISDCKYTGHIIDITRQVATMSEEDNYFILNYRQFPIIPAFRLTIDKSQGQTITNNRIYLKIECFNHGQLYVALSRIRNTKFLHVFTYNKLK